MEKRALGTAGAALLLCLFGTAACQREGDTSSGNGGMFGITRQGGPANGAAPAPAPGPAPLAQPALVPGAPANPLVPPVAGGGTVTPAAPAGVQDRRLRITNNSGQVVTLIKGSAASDSNWGADRIPSGVLQSGSQVMVDFDDGNGECMYDLQATLADGAERVRRGVNICRVTDWQITPDGSEVR